MKIRKLFALLAAAALAIGLLTGCGGSTLSSEAASAANAVQGTNLVIRFRTGSELDKALTQALREGHDMNSILDALCQALGLEEGALRLTAENLTAQAGQRVVELYAVRGASSADAAAAAANLLDEVLSRLTGGKYTGRISMEESGGVYYVAVDITVQEPGRLTSGGGGGSSGGSGGDVSGEIGGWGGGGTTTNPGEGGSDDTQTDEGEPITVTIPKPDPINYQPNIPPITAEEGNIKVFTSFNNNSLETSGLQDVLNKAPSGANASFSFTIIGGQTYPYLSTRLSNALQSCQSGSYTDLLEALDDQYIDTSNVYRRNYTGWERLPIEQLEYAIKYHKYTKETATNFYSFVVVSGDFTKKDINEKDTELDRRAAEALFTKLCGIIDRYTSEGTNFGENNEALGKYFYLLDTAGNVVYGKSTNKPMTYTITYSSGYQEVGLVRVKEGDTYHYYAAVCVVANKNPVN